MKAKKRERRTVTISHCSAEEASVIVKNCIDFTHQELPNRELILSGIEGGQLSLQFYDHLAGISWLRHFAVMDTFSHYSVFDGDKLCSAISARSDLKTLWLTVPGITQRGIDAIPVGVRRLTLSVTGDLSFERLSALSYLSIHADEKVVLRKETGKSLRRVRSVAITGRELDPRFLDGLAAVHSLRKLSICTGASSLPESLLTRLRQIVNLEWLTLPDVPADAGENYFAKCLSNLRYLHLTGVQEVRNRQLGGLTRLRRLYVNLLEEASRSKAHEDILQLRQLLPNCRIYLSW